MKNYTRLMAGAAFALAVAGCGGSKNVKNGELKTTIEASDNYLEEIGIGAADSKMETATQRRATSRNAAIVAAQYQLTAKLKGVKVEGGVTIEKAMETNSKISATVDAMVKGAEITKTEWLNDDGCVVTVRLNKKVVEKELKDLGVKL